MKTWPKTTFSYALLSAKNSRLDGKSCTFGTIEFEATEVAADSDKGKYGPYGYKAIKRSIEYAHPNIKLGGENQTHELGALVHELSLKKNGRSNDPAAWISNGLDSKVHTFAQQSHFIQCIRKLAKEQNKKLSCTGIEYIFPDRVQDLLVIVVRPLGSSQKGKASKKRGAASLMAADQKLAKKRLVVSYRRRMMRRIMTKSTICQPTKKKLTNVERLVSG